MHGGLLEYRRHVPTLISVNVGLPRDVPWDGRVVHTGAWKEPVTGPHRVRRLNIDGDGQGDLGGHGGENRAVLVYQLASYRHWATELGRKDLSPGNFGENLTVEGLPDDEVCIGDRYRIGDAVFEVTQPRVTCYRAGMRLGEPRMAALLVSHGRPGFYCRVITEGEIEAGQDIVKVADGPEHVTVAEADALLYLPGHSREALERALRVPALSAGWQGSFRSMLEESTSPPPAWQGFRPLTVSGIRAESSVIRSVTLTAPDGVPLPNRRPGQSIALRLGPGVVRNYSLSNDPGAPDYRISVKLEEHGAGSGFIHRRVSVGDTVDVAAPRGAFVLRDGADPVLLISAGVGITPVLSMLHALAGSRRDVWWLHGARNGAQRAFAEEVATLLNGLSNSHSRVLYSNPDTGDHDYDGVGRISVDTLSDLGLPSIADAYLCGPAAFMADLESGLAEYGLDPDRIHSEAFGAAAGFTPGIASASVPPHVPAGAPGSGPEVQFARSAVAAPFGPPSATLLEFAEACDVPVRWSCRTGVCHNCETALVAGDVRYDPEPLEPPADGNILICCARPTGDIVVDL